MPSEFTSTCILQVNVGEYVMIKSEEKEKPDYIAKIQYMYEDGAKEKWFHAVFFWYVKHYY